MRRFLLACAGVVGCLSVPASSAEYILQGSSTVNRVTVISNGVFSYDPLGAISISDPIVFRMRFKTDGATVSPTFDADPTVNIYSLATPLSLNFKIGDYRFVTPANRRPIDLSVQLWNDRVVGQPTDSQSFSLFDFTVGGRKPILPFAMPVGQVAEGISINNFGSANLRSSDLLSEFPSLDGFRTSFSYIVQSGNYSVIANGDQAAFTLTAVPEPSTWIMLIVGFGLTGKVLRRRRHLSVLA